MYKLILYPLLLVAMLMFYIDQLNQQVALQTYYTAKYALNRATHAAAMQLDKIALADGFLYIDPLQAYEQGRLMLFQNLQLDENGQITSHTFLQNPVKVLHFEVINDNLPLQYDNPQYNIELLIEAPTVIMVVEIYSPGIFSRRNQLKWEIVGSSKIIAPHSF